MNKHAPDMTTGYREALSFGGGIAVIGLLIDVTSMRMVRDKMAGWEDPEGDMSMGI